MAGNPFADLGAPEKRAPGNPPKEEATPAAYANPFADLGKGATAAKEESSFGKSAAKAGMAVLRAPERYIDAPFRAAVANAAPFVATGNYGSALKEGARAFKDQFGEDPEKAASFGVLGDIAVAPSNVIPYGAAAKGVRALGRGAATLAKEAPLVQKAVAGAGNLAAKGAETLTGVPSRVIKTYAKNVDDIERMIGRYGGNVANAADDIKAGINTSVQRTKTGINSAITRTLDEADALVDVTPVLDSLKKVRTQITEKLRPDEAKGIDQLISQVGSMADESGTITAKDLYEVKQFLQEGARSAYLQPGSVFAKGKSVQRAAKEAASTARSIVREGVPSIAELDDKLARLHSVERQMNKNILKEGASENALMTIGSGAKDRNRKALDALGEITGNDFVPQTEKLAALKEFADAGWLPRDATGKALLRSAAGTTIGATAGGPLGAILGAAATSPAAVRRGIQYGRVPVQAAANAAALPSRGLSQVLRMIEENPTRFKALLAGTRGGSAMNALAQEDSSVDPALIQALQERKQR